MQRPIQGQLKGRREANLPGRAYIRSERQFAAARPDKIYEQRRRYVVVSPTYLLNGLDFQQPLRAEMAGSIQNANQELTGGKPELLRVGDSVIP